MKASEVQVKSSEGGFACESELFHVSCAVAVAPFCTSVLAGVRASKQVAGERRYAPSANERTNGKCHIDSLKAGVCVLRQKGLGRFRFACTQPAERVGELGTRVHALGGSVWQWVSTHYCDLIG